MGCGIALQWKGYDSTLQYMEGLKVRLLSIISLVVAVLLSLQFYTQKPQK